METLQAFAYLGSKLSIETVYIDSSSVEKIKVPLLLNRRSYWMYQ